MEAELPLSGAGQAILTSSETAELLAATPDVSQIGSPPSSIGRHSHWSKTLFCPQAGLRERTPFTGRRRSLGILENGTPMDIVGNWLESTSRELNQGRWKGISVWEYESRERC